MVKKTTISPQAPTLIFDSKLGNLHHVLSQEEAKLADVSISDGPWMHLVWRYKL